MPWKAKEIVFTMLPADPGVDEVPRRDPAGLEGRVQVHVDELAELRGGDGEDRGARRLGDAGDVDHPVQPEYDASAASTSRLATPRLRRRSGHPDGAQPGRDRGDEARRHGRSPRRRPLRDQQLPPRQPDPSGRAGDHDGLAGQLRAVTDVSATPGGQPAAGRLRGDLR